LENEVAEGRMRYNYLTMSKDHYKTLGVDKKATEAEIKAAFRKLAHQHHPDKNGGDDKKFKEINEAYQTLSDKNKRAQYDQFGSDGPQFGGGQGNPFGGGGFGGFSWEDIMRQAQQQGGGNMHFDMNDIDLGDLFGAAFGFGGGRRTPRGRNIEVQIKMTFKESVRGFTRELQVPDYKDGKQSGMKKVSVTIPAGVEHGQQLQMDGAGETVTNGRPGNLIITAIVESHPSIKKEGSHLVMDLHVPLVDALLGKKIEIETLDGKETIEIPESMPVNHVIKLKGKGVSAGFLRNGDFIIRTHIDMPKKLSKDARKVIEELRKEL
jgi:DnaJ-class molecular chaperone